MNDFTYAISTKVLFGRNKITGLAEEIEKYADSVLFVYGQGSIKKLSVYDTVNAALRKSGIDCVELAGVQPNPRITTVRAGIQLCKDHEVDLILAAGGGSTIDCAKAIAAGVYYDGDPWDLFLKGDSLIRDALPLGTILTVAGTGSEMNGNAVITNEETKQKFAIHHDLLRPKFSILDPTYTFSVPRLQTAAGIVDIISHILEQDLQFHQGFLRAGQARRKHAENLPQVRPGRATRACRLRGTRTAHVDQQPCPQRTARLR